jgi:serine/threonine protein kinase
VCPSCHALQASPVLPLIQRGTKIELGYARIVIEDRLGEGAIGIVWRGWLFHSPDGPRGKEPPMLTAVKELRPHANVQPKIRKLFLHEAQALQRLDHPNVVGFLDLFEWGTTLAIAMELVVGDTLADVIARHIARARLAGPHSLPGMPFQRAWHYFQQLLGALAATHALRIVHRDVKPSNIFIRKDGVVKLGDFGIAHLAPPSNATAPMPAHRGGRPPTGEISPGTAEYMSPEQVLARPLDGRSDLYSAAMVLYEMLSGRTPFASSEERSEFAVRLDQAETPPPPIRTWLPQAPPILDALFARALAKDPAQRFTSAIEMGNAFRSALGLADTPVWRAQGELAEAAAVRDAYNPPQRARRMATLRDFLFDGYKNRT